MSNGWIKGFIGNVPVFSVIIDQLRGILQATNKEENSQKIIYTLWERKKKMSRKTHSNDWEILCGVDKGTYTESSIGWGCFDLNG